MRMASLVALGVVAAVRVFAQASYGSSALSYDSASFSYHGCSSVDLSRFDEPIAYSDGSLTHAACQEACQGYKFAALFPEYVATRGICGSTLTASSTCACGNDASAVVPLDESACDDSSPKKPQGDTCGSECPEEQLVICIVFVQSSRPDESPESTTKVTSVLQVPSTLTDEATSSTSSSSTLLEPTAPAPPLTKSGDSSEPPLYTDAHQPPNSAPESSTSDKPVPSTGTDNDQYGDPTLSPDPITASLPTLSGISEERNLTVGDPPGPSLVPDSNSIQFFAPAVSALGGLALIVAMIV